jgi:S-layer family protein
MTTRAAVLTAALASFAATAWPAVPTASVGEREFRHTSLQLDPQLVEAGEGVFNDARTGRPASLMLSVPLVPGTGVGNTLGWDAPPSEAMVGDRAWAELLRFVEGQRKILDVDTTELAAPRIGVFEDGALIIIHAPRALGGIAVRDSGLTAVVNHGNLVLLGLQSWDKAGPPAAAYIGEAAARAAVQGHAEPSVVESFADAARLEYVPVAAAGRYEYRLAWVVTARLRGDVGTWEGLVDAASGELLAFADRNAYAQRRAIGGVYPLSNDQRPPDGIEQPGWPMPFLDVTLPSGTVTTTTGGTFACSAGAATTALAGPFARIVDACGPINESSAGDLDLGASGGTHCVVPAGHSAGDTHAARTAYYEVNRAAEQARGWLPTNPWLQAQLTVNTNQTGCNAFWDGSSITLSGPMCNVNIGEIAGFVTHEWGHGLDDNGIVATISSPAEALADAHAIVRHARSCMSRGGNPTAVCTGFGDECIGTPATGCTGRNDVDFAQHRCNLPHTVSWIQSGFSAVQCTGGAPACPMGSGTPCGRLNHCESVVPEETVWDLYKRDLQAPPFSLDANTALEITTRLTFLGTQAVTSWYTCAVGGGCGATGGYMLFLAADDDDGNPANGTPHMTAIRAAFERHEIHCATPAPANTGCSGGPTAAPTVVTSVGDGTVTLTWGAVPNAARYYVFRAEGVSACDTGKVKVGDVTGTTFTDTGLLGGRAYSYVVLPVGGNTSCFGRASACATATPVLVPCAATADFTLTCSPSTVTTVPGGAATSSCTVQSLNSFNTQVALSCAGLPANVTCAYNPATVTPAPNTSIGSTLTVSVSGSVPAGSYNFQAVGTSGALIRTQPMTLVVNALAAVPFALDVDTGGNHVLEPNETVDVAPTWRNVGTTAITLTGASSGFTGPAGPTYANPDATASYGTIPVNGAALCSDCYSVAVTAAARPQTHWDSTLVETITPSSAAKTWTLHVGASFTDVPVSSPFYRFIETILHRSVTGGTGSDTYGPTGTTTRDQMAVFVLRTAEPNLTPPACAPPNLFPRPAPSAAGSRSWRVAARPPAAAAATTARRPPSPASRWRSSSSARSTRRSSRPPAARRCSPTSPRAARSAAGSRSWRAATWSAGAAAGTTARRPASPASRCPSSSR